MTDQDAWNKLVSQYNKNIGKKEELIQSSWGFAFSTIFNFSDSEIVPQSPVKMGSTNKYADFIIRNDIDDLFVVELKQHTLLRQAGEGQLFSYLNQLKINIGILVCDKLYIYEFDYTKKNDNYSFVEIDFILDNPDGIKFVGLFKKDNFEKQKIIDYIAHKNQSESNIYSIRNELTQDKILQLVKNHLIEKYPSEDVEKVLGYIDIIVSEKNYAVKAPPTSTSVKSEKDNTQYTLNGTPTGGKGPTVFKAVKYYVDNHPGITLSQLQNIFPDEVAKPSYNKMIRRLEEVEEKDWKYKRFKYRYNPILLADGHRIVVSTQWTTENMKTFIFFAKKVGLIIEPVK